MDRLVIVHTPLMEKLLFRSMQGFEAISSLFHYTVEMVSKDGRINLKSLLGQPLSLQIKQLNLADHWLNGEIISFGLKGMESGASRYYVYYAEVRPRLWYLTQNADFRIFQELTVPDIIHQILSKYDIKVDNQIRSGYRQWGYCVQYNESDFDFISRLMEHEGIYYFFTHEKNKHTLVLADAPEAHKPITQPIIPYRGSGASAIQDEICIDSWQVEDIVTTGFVSMDDYDFHKPYATLLDVRSNSASYASERTEVFEWPGRFIDASHAQFYTRIRQQEKAAQQELMYGSATTCMLVPGAKMTLIKSARPEDDQEYLIIRANYTLWDNTYASGTDAERGQRTDFDVLPGNFIWRSPRVTVWPKTQGPQTARVVCPEGETIWTDEYGRVKVKFHWDRYAKGDDTSSCWIRVASAWAGQGYGGVQIPRLNDEVLVDFINGDPDRPIIVGRVYNDANKPPWDLPANATQMGFFSRSKAGHKETANALRFEDKMGEEQVWIHAEKNMDTDIENDETLDVGVNRTKTVGKDETTLIKRHKDETIVGNQNVLVQQNHDETVGGNQSRLVKKNQTETVALNKAESIGIAKALSVGMGYQTTVGMAMNTSVGISQSSQIGVTKSLSVGKSYSASIGETMSLGVGQRKTESVGQVSIHDVGEHLELVCGKAKIVLTKDGTIYLKGKAVEIQTQDGINGDAALIQWNCGASKAPPDAPE